MNRQCSTEEAKGEIWLLEVGRWVGGGGGGVGR